MGSFVTELVVIYLHLWKKIMVTHLRKWFFYTLFISDFTVNEVTFTHHKPVLHIYCINKKLMVLTNAQKQKRYRKNLKARGLYHAMKFKHAKRMRIYRQSFTGQAK